MFECFGCGGTFTGRRTRVYCSMRCQRERQRRELTAKWLATGVATATTHEGHYVRRYIAEEQSHRCAICGARDVWNDKPLRFVLDHVDGDSTNNARANLRLLCPNCDSQLPTYKSRNRGRGRFSRRQRYADGKSF